jgi:hypothetical protein
VSTPATIPDAETTRSPGRLVVRMVSGRLVDLVDPDPATIAVEDLAHALARVCRFTGNVTEWWSVADHALLCRELICEAGASELAVAALHHGSHEAIVGDIITPVRELLGPDRVHALTRRLDAAIAVALGLDVELLWHPLVTDVDRAAAHLEARALQGGATGHLLNPAPDLRFAPRTLRSDGPVLAARRFLSTDRRLRGHQQDRDGDG